MFMSAPTGLTKSGEPNAGMPIKVSGSVVAWSVLPGLLPVPTSSLSVVHSNAFSAHVLRTGFRLRSNTGSPAVAVGAGTGFGPAVTGCLVVPLDAGTLVVFPALGVLDVVGLAVAVPTVGADLAALTIRSQAVLVRPPPPPSRQASLARSAISPESVVRNFLMRVSISRPLIRGNAVVAALVVLRLRVVLGG